MSALFSNGDAKIAAMYGVGCNTDDLWKEVMVPVSGLAGWMNDSIHAGTYVPGECDVIISDRNRLTVRLCHESDIHVLTTESATIRECVERWLHLGYRVMARNDSSTAREDWREVHTVADALDLQ